jgi:peptidoglycan/LPS O-acetylase OafA/YrhL
MPASKIVDRGGPAALPDDSLERLACVDALRGLAALSVVLFHLATMSQLALPPWLALVRSHGWLGVNLFFVLSAFTLFHSGYRRRGEPHAGLRFFVRRFFRIAPLFYLMLAVHLAIKWWYYGLVPSLGEVLLNAGFLFNFSSERFLSLDWAGWSIGTEMVFYALLPLLLAVVDSLRRAVVLVGLTLLAFGSYVALANTDRLADLSLYTSIVTQGPVFAAGIVAFFLYRRFVADRQARLGLLAASLLVVFAMLTWLLLRQDVNLRRPGSLLQLYLWAGNFGILLLGLALHGPRLLVNGCTRFLGRISYSLYLVHPVVIFGLRSVYAHLAGLDLPNGAGFVLGVAATLLVLVPLAAVSYHLIEEPGLRLGRRLIRRFLAGRRACPAEPGGLSSRLPERRNVPCRPATTSPAATIVACRPSSPASTSALAAPSG